MKKRKYLSLTFFTDKLQRNKREKLKQKFAENISEKYRWRYDNLFTAERLIHRRGIRTRTVINQTDKIQIEQLVKKYMPNVVKPASNIIYRQERTRLISVITEINGQDGEQKQLENLIFRRKEQQWKKQFELHREEVCSLRHEIIHQKKTIEILEKRLSEHGVDSGKLYTEFRKRLEQQLRLERQRLGL